MTELEALRKYNKQGNIQYDFKCKYFQVERLNNGVSIALFNPKDL